MVAVCVVAVILGAGLALALVPHVLGAVGPDVMHPGFEAGWPDPVENPEQRYRNYLAGLIVIPVAAPVGVVFAVVVAFPAGVRASGSRRARVATVASAAAVGVALGYASLVLVSQTAYGPTANGFVVEEYPVTRDFAAIATNAVSLAVSAGVGSAFAGVAGTVVAPSARADSLETSKTGDVGVDADEDAVPAAVDGSDGSDDEREESAGAGGTEPERPSTAVSAPASDYRETGPKTDSDAPQYDPDDRDWDGGD